MTMYKVVVSLKNKNQEQEFGKKGSAERFFMEEKRRYFGTGVLIALAEQTPSGKWLMIKHN